MVAAGSIATAIPPSVWAVVLLGVLQSVVLLVRKPWSRTKHGARDAPAASVTDCSVGSPKVLLAFRAAALAWTVFCAAHQLLRKRSLGIFKFYTVWNYYLLMVFFAAATLASLQAHRSQQRKRRVSSKGGTVSWLQYTVIALAHVNLETVMVVDVLTWTVLWPMLKSDPNPAKRGYYRAELFNFDSYNQHGFNAVLMLAETFLDRIAFQPYLMGLVGLWSSAYGLWTFYHFAATGRWMYPFLAADKPWSPTAYFLLFAAHWLLLGAAMGIHWLKGLVLSRFGSYSGPAGATAVAGSPNRPVTRSQTGTPARTKYA